MRGVAERIDGDFFPEWDRFKPGIVPIGFEHLAKFAVGQSGFGWA
ncbi:hypothetical protein SCOR_04655 [Sulfidibacter corallicola]